MKLIRKKDYQHLIDILREATATHGRRNNGREICDLRGGNLLLKFQAQSKT